MRWRWLMGFAALGLLGCGESTSDEGSLEIASGNLTGKVNGASWSLVSAQSNAFLSGADGFTLELWAETIAACEGFGQGNSLMLFVPARLGESRFGSESGVNGTFVISSDDTTTNLVTLRGVLRVDQLTESTIRGGVSMTFDEGNSVSGEFEATVCP